MASAREKERESIIEGGNCDKHATFDAPLATIATFFLTNATSPLTFATSVITFDAQFFTFDAQIYICSIFGDI